MEKKVGSLKAIAFAKLTKIDKKICQRSNIWTITFRNRKIVDDNFFSSLNLQKNCRLGHK